MNKTNYSKHKKAKIRYIGFLLFFILYFSFFLVSLFLKFPNKWWSVLFFGCFYLILLIWKKEFKSLVVILSFLLTVSFMKILMFWVKVKSFSLSAIPGIVDSTSILNFLISFIFSYTSIFLFRMSAMEKKFSILILPQEMINYFMANFSSLKNFDIPAFLAEVIFSSYNSMNDDLRTQEKSDFDENIV